MCGVVATWNPYFISTVLNVMEWLETEGRRDYKYLEGKKYSRPEDNTMMLSDGVYYWFHSMCSGKFGVGSWTVYFAKDLMEWKVDTKLENEKSDVFYKIAEHTSKICAPRQRKVVTTLNECSRDVKEQ
eukprot:CAMPEP_0178880008 /NCGR_PEP_ID=MMETSP0747-20121128/12236_1 /TAXON_ID=913974 /ORGANISM="Nitzschia punctata, Strain CCMP561" /LENGTH=127 /DNA_ID=CAMNT_0020547877 /DNA_START=126 /DNA_END=509 /DNA_ORIENTATION=-